MNTKVPSMIFTCVTFDCGTGLTVFQADSPMSYICDGAWSGGNASA